jgi:hypothetical protein
MEPTLPSNEAERAERRIPIFINDTRHFVTDETLTGAELKTLGGIPPQNKLFHETRGSGADEEIRNDQTVELKPGDRFYDLPVGVVGTTGLLPSVAAQIDRAREDFPDLEVSSQPDGFIRVLVPHLSIGPGWDRHALRALVLLPPGFPTAKPNGFEADPGLRLADGRPPSQGYGMQQIGSESWGHYCWQPQTWAADRETLWRYIKFIQRRFAEVLG